MLLLCLVMFWTRGVPRLAGTASKRRRGSRPTEAWTRSYAWGPDFDICGLGSWKNGTNYWDREIGKQIAVANKLQTIVVNIFSTHWWQVAIVIELKEDALFRQRKNLGLEFQELWTFGFRRLKQMHLFAYWKEMENQRARQEEQAQKEKEHNSLSSVFGWSPCFVLIIQIRFGCRDSINSNAPSNFEDLDTQNSLDECCIRGARFLFLIDAVIPSSHWCDAKGRTGAVERRAAPSKGTAGGHELGLFGRRASRFLEMKAVWI